MTGDKLIELTRQFAATVRFSGRTEVAATLDALVKLMRIEMEKEDTLKMHIGHCPNCRARFPIDFCPSCGEKLPE